jgi:hypothetical protein
MARKKTGTLTGPLFVENGNLEDVNKSKQVELSGGKIVGAQDPKDQKPVSKFYDPLFVLDYLQFKSKNTAWSLSYQLLRKISYRNGVIASIINTRINQVSLFSSQYLTPNDRIGYTVYPKEQKYGHLLRQANPSLPPQTMSEEKVKKMMYLMDFIENCGDKETLGKDPERPGFMEFLKKITRDSLTFDQLCFEIVKDPKTNKPAAIYPVDAGTIRIADPKTKRDKGIYFVQYLDGILYTGYTYDEMAFSLRNPTTDIRTNGYGVSEIEMALNYIAAQIYGEEYNKRFFTQGSAPKGILNVKGTSLPTEELDAFRRAWHSQIAGVNNAWKTPIIASEGLEWINFNQSNREMEFGRWLEYLVNVICAIYQIDPVEINFPNKGGVSGGAQSRSLSDSSAIERIKFSKDKGLVPLLKFMETVMNKYIVYPLTDGEWEFSFYGYTDVIDAQKMNMETQEVGYLRTVNEMRSQYGLKPLSGGDVILNPTYVQYKMQKEQLLAEQGQQPPDDFGGDVDPEGETEDETHADDISAGGTEIDESSEEYDGESDFSTSVGSMGMGSMSGIPVGGQPPSSGVGG